MVDVLSSTTVPTGTRATAKLMQVQFREVMVDLAATAGRGAVDMRHDACRLCRSWVGGLSQS
jgi:hypothetical protein